MCRGLTFGVTTGIHGVHSMADERSMSILGRAAFAKVSSVIFNGDWHWPRSRNNLIQSSIPCTSCLPQNDRDDEVVWSISSSGHSSVKHAWEALTHQIEEASIVWFSKNVPKWAFVVWL